LEIGDDGSWRGLYVRSYQEKARTKNIEHRTLNFERKRKRSILTSHIGRLNANVDPSFVASAKKERRSILRSLGEEGTY